MNTKDENSSVCDLLLEAHKQIDICCETLCDKSVVKAYIEALENKVDELEQQLRKCNNG